MGVPAPEKASMAKFTKNNRNVLLAAVDVPRLYAHFGIELTTEGSQYRSYCPFHDDTGRPNLSVSQEGLYHCFACGQQGSLIDLTAYALRQLHANKRGTIDGSVPLLKAEVAVAFEFLEMFVQNTAIMPQPIMECRMLPTDTPPEMPPIPIEEVATWSQNLWDNYPNTLEFLRTERGLANHIIVGQHLGVDDARSPIRITIPIFDSSGLVRNVRKYLPHTFPGEAKFLGYAKSYGRNRRLNPHSGIGPGPILLMAGEMDCLLAQSLGFAQADTFTSGEQSLPRPDMVADWKGKDVYVWYDNDIPGRGGARHVANALATLDCRPRIVEFPPDFPEGEDFTDLVVKHGYTRSMIDELIASAQAHEPPQPVGVHATIKSYRFTDLGNAERFADQHGHQARWWSERRQWFTCAGEDGKWREHGSDNVRRWMQECARAMQQEKELYDDAARDSFESWCRSSENDGRTRGAMAQAQALLQIQPDDFDHDPYILNVHNGIVNLKTGELLPHSADRFCLKQVAIDYDSRCANPHNWLKFLHHNLKEDQQFIDWLQKAIGYMLTGSTEEKLIFFVKGPPDTGKTKFIETLLALLGEYAVQAPKSLVMVQSHQVHPEHIALLYGNRLASVSELDDSERFNEGQIKWLSGGDSLTARFMRENSFTFTPTHKLLLSANKYPSASSDAAVWRRLRILPFEVIIPPDQQNKRLFEEVLKPELPAILRWAVEGAIRWSAEGLGEAPMTIEVATKQYRESMDPLTNFYQERCIIGEGCVNRSAITGAYLSWCDSTHTKSLGVRELYARLDERFATVPDQTGTMAYDGIRLKVDYTKR